MAYTISSGMEGGGWRWGQNFRKVFAGGVRYFYLGGGGCIIRGEGGHEIVNLELHNPSIKSIFRITKLICLYF